ncbi:MAG: PA0069 family radical SAM protein [bacterium]
MNSFENIKGRGAQLKLNNKFSSTTHELRDDFLEYCHSHNESAIEAKTIHLKVHPKSIVNKVTSPDVGLEYSLNPYQGCEHGCIYCYARNSHEFWGYDAGLDFESKILIKENAPSLLEAFIKRKSWHAKTIVLSGNTDCYQPAEKEYQITRKCLEVFLKYKHPVSIITKNSLILRDLDLLKKLNEDRLIAVNISVTSLYEKTRRLLEPRTASVHKRLNTIKILSDNAIPVNVMLAPIIPSINSHEILEVAKKVSELGAVSMGHTMIRLNGVVGTLFSDWIHKKFPDKAEKVLHQIAECHGGKLNDSRFGTRMRGEGIIAKQINDMMKLAKRKYFKSRSLPPLNTSLHESCKSDQLKLF